jgi:hypothetical protein
MSLDPTKWVAAVDALMSWPINPDSNLRKIVSAICNKVSNVIKHINEPPKIPEKFSVFGIAFLAYMQLFFALQLMVYVIEGVKVIHIAGEVAKKSSPKVLIIFLLAALVGVCIGWLYKQIKAQRQEMNHHWSRMSQIQKWKTTILFLSLVSFTLLMSSNYL